METEFEDISFLEEDVYCKTYNITPRSTYSQLRMVIGKRDLEPEI